MRNNLLKISISVAIITAISSPVFAESLFRTGISQSVYPMEPRSLYASVKAKSIGDLVTVVIDEQVTTSDNLKFDIQKSSNTTDGFSSVINDIFNRKVIPDVNNYSGSNQTGNQANISRSSKFKNTITTQVVQIMPNGNLLIQGKKTAINSGEKMDIIMSGIIDPRLLDKSGSISSNLVANLQIAVVGKGTISRSDSEGTLNKIIKYLF